MAATSDAENDAVLCRKEANFRLFACLFLIGKGPFFRRKVQRGDFRHSVRSSLLLLSNEYFTTLTYLPRLGDRSK